MNITLKSHLYIAYKQKGKQMIHVTRVTNKQMAKRMRFYLFISVFWFQLLFVVTSVCLFHLSCVFIFLCLFLLLFLFVYVSQDHLQTIIIAFLRPKRRAGCWRIAIEACLRKKITHPVLPDTTPTTDLMTRQRR